MCITPESLALERSGRTVPFHNFIVEYKKNSNTIYVRLCYNINVIT